MSLKTFHIVFIGFAILIAFGFGAWNFSRLSRDGIHLLYGILSVSTGIVLIFYGVRFLRKFKHLSYL